MAVGAGVPCHCVSCIPCDCTHGKVYYTLVPMNEMTTLLPHALAGVLTTSDAARELNLSQDRVTRLLEQGELVGLRKANRWFLTPDAIAAFRRHRYGATQDLCGRALAATGVRLTPKQRAI